MPIIAVSNQKGGVGKTTSTLNVGAALREMGKRVLLVDLDPQGSLTVGAGILDVDNIQTLHHGSVGLFTGSDNNHVAVEHLTISVPR
jgi:chromosome partitioning protein